MSRLMSSDLPLRYDILPHQVTISTGRSAASLTNTPTLPGTRKTGQTTFQQNGVEVGVDNFTKFKMTKCRKTSNELKETPT